MPQPQTVELDIDSELAEFAVANDLDLSTLLEQAIDRKRDSIRRENPEPSVPDTVSTYLEQIHTRVASGSSTGASGFQENIPYAPVSISALRKDNGYRVRVLVDDVGRLPDAEVTDTLAESGAFLTAIRTQLCATFADLNGTDPEEYTFECIDHTVEHPDLDDFGAEKATYETFVPVERENEPQAAA